MLLRNAEAKWITLADRAANWSPWKRAAENLKDKARGFRDRFFSDNNGEENKGGPQKEVSPLSICTKQESDNIDFNRGETTMAGEVIQAIIAPLSWDPKELKAVLGEAEFQKFVTRKAEKHDDVVKYVQVDEGKFESLDVAPLGSEHSEVKAIFGVLRAAEKADSLMAMPMTPGHMNEYGCGGLASSSNSDCFESYEPFSRLLDRKNYAMASQIKGIVELNDDWDAIENEAGRAVDAFKDWLTGAIQELRKAQEASVVKSDKPRWSDRLRYLFGGTPRIDSADSAHSADNAEKGEIEMTQDEIREMISEAVSATVQGLVEKADADERAKAELAEKEDKEARIKALEDQIAELKSKAGSGEKGADKPCANKGDGQNLAEGEGTTEKPTNGTASVTTGRGVDHVDADGETGKDSDGTDVTLPMDVAKRFSELIAQMKRVIGLTEKSDSQDPQISDQIKALAEKTDKLERALRAPGPASGSEDARATNVLERRVLALKSDRVDAKFDVFNGGHPGARKASNG